MKRLRNTQSKKYLPKEKAMKITFPRIALAAALLAAFTGGARAAPTYDSTFAANVPPSPYQAINLASDGGYFISGGEDIYGSAEEMPCQPVFTDQINVPGYEQLFDVLGHSLYSPIKLDEHGRMDCAFQPWRAQGMALLPDGAGRLYGFGGRARLTLYDTVDGILWDSPYHIARFFEDDGRLDATVRLGTYWQRGEFEGNFIPPSTLGLPDNRTHTVALDNNAPFQRLIMGGMHRSGSATEYYNIWRLNSDGSQDASFQPLRLNTPDEGHLAQVNKIAVQPDGKILIGGAFKNIDGRRAGNFIRLNADGTLDAEFLETMQANQTSSYVEGESVNDFLVQPDGSIIVAGRLQFADEELYRFNLFRFLPDGSFDYSFTPPQFIGGTPWKIDGVKALALQSDGKIIVTLSVDAFSSFADVQMIRLNADGTLDETFQIRFTSRNDIPATVTSAVFDRECRLVVAFEGGWETPHPVVEFPLTGEVTPPVPGLVRLLIDDSPGCIH